MSQARDTFFELLKPKIEELGYTFNKSKFNFIKTINDAICTIEFNWDGRGGMTYLNHIGLKINYNYIAKSLKTLLKIKDYPIYWNNGNKCHHDDRIPQMYSKELVELANNMAFKKMAAIPFEEKYPLERIKKTVAKAEEIIINEIIPIHIDWADEHKLLLLKIENLKARFDVLDTHATLLETMIVKILSKKLKVQEPKFISDLTIFSNKSIDDLWNMQEYDFDNMEAKFNNLKF